MLVCKPRVSIFMFHTVQAAVLRHTLEAEKVCFLCCNIDMSVLTSLNFMRADSFMQFGNIQQVICHMLSNQIGADQRLPGSTTYIGLPKQDVTQEAAQDGTHLTPLGKTLVF